MLYRILWFSVMLQESAIGIPMSLPSQTSLPFPFPPTLQRSSSAEPLFELPESYSKFPLALCFTHGIVNFCYSLYTSPLLPPLLPPCLLVCSLCLFLHCCPENKFISAISSDSIYMCQCTVFIFLFLTYFILYNGL